MRKDAQTVMFDRRSAVGVEVKAISITNPKTQPDIAVGPIRAAVLFRVRGHSITERETLGQSGHHVTQKVNRDDIVQIGCQVNAVLKESSEGVNYDATVRAAAGELVRILEDIKGSLMKDFGPSH